MPITPATRTYRFGPFQLDANERVLFHERTLLPLTAKAIDTLVALVEAHGRIVSKEELMERVWPGTHVEENNLAQNISTLRKTLEAAQAGVAYIETIPRRGYRFLGEVVESETSSAPVFDPSFTPPPVRYARSGDVNIAYQVLGEGPRDLVFVMGWISHLDCIWAEPLFARFLQRLATFSRLIIFDKRGTGLSDRVSDLPTLEQRMDDVRAVLDAVGSERAALCGVSEGGPMCALYAATYPEKTDALIMIGTYARGLRAPDYPWGSTLEQLDDFIDAMQRGWGGPFAITRRAPSLANDPAFRERWAKYLRMGASPGAAAALQRMNSEVDVRHVLPTIHVPSLVIHRTGDLCLPVDEGRFVAEHIPGARFVELPGADHLPFVGDQDAIVDAIEEFLTGASPSAASPDVLATIVAVKTIGEDDAAVQRHLTHAQREADLFRGRAFLDENGVFIAAFDGPARAIRCATAIRDFTRQLGIGTRIGIHTGECRLQPRPMGPAVDTAMAIADSASANEVLASRTVRDLVSGSGIAFRSELPDVFRL